MGSSKQAACDQAYLYMLSDCYLLLPVHVTRAVCGAGVCIQSISLARAERRCVGGAGRSDGQAQSKTESSDKSHLEG